MKKYLWGTLILVVLLATASFAANAQSTDRDLSGWAWSSNIGWVSFNSTDAGTGTNGVGTSPVPYKVQLKANGDLTGYAWSSNIGWIKFDPSLAGAPSGATRASVASNGHVTGYIRACGGTVDKDCNSDTRTDGWDGWISLSGDKHTTGDTNGNGGVTYVESGSTATLKGYSWGSDVVGWLKFSPTATVETKVKTGSDSLTFTAAGVTVTGVTAGNGVLSANSSGQVTSPVVWDSVGYVSCSASTSKTSGPGSSSGWTGSVAVEGSSSVTFSNVTAQTKYQLILSCSDGEDSNSRTINVTVDPYTASTFSCTQPAHALQCTSGGSATFIYTSIPEGTPSTTLLNSCPTSGTNYCVYTCESGYERNGNRCVISDLEEF